SQIKNRATNVFLILFWDLLPGFWLGGGGGSVSVVERNHRQTTGLSVSVSLSLPPPLPPLSPPTPLSPPPPPPPRPLSPERPRVSLLQRSPSSPVVCHATGFYPDRVVVFWRRDGQELHEQVDPGEVLPNHDGTFQVSVDLDLTAVPQEDWGRYECVVQLKGIEDISTPLDPALIRTNGGKSHLLVFILVGVAVAAVVVAAAVVGVFVYQKRNGEWIKLSRRTNT
uniref:Ig-like domain-containing protein n=1 Tax=Gadus morhua TaxID=8049 RepID=A0A8C5BD91_GADMO